MRFQNVLGICLCLFSYARALLRMDCGQLMLDRMDPIISPGQMSGHMHQIVGGNGFNPSETYADTQAASCTTCQVTQDKSNYWTPTLYYQRRDGTYQAVPVFMMSVYYFAWNTSATVFPEGWQMVAGSPLRRTYDKSRVADGAISFMCMGTGYSPGPVTPYFPRTSCYAIRAQINFPTCWDGKSFTKDTQNDHLVYSTDGVQGKSCPPKYSNIIPLFLEVYFSTYTFEFWEGTSRTGQPFVTSHGDPTGYGFHGDYLFGWDKSIMKNILTRCTGGDAPNSGFGALTDCLKAYPALQTTVIAGGSCKLSPKYVTNTASAQSPGASLPGCNPILAAGVDLPSMPTCSGSSYAFAGATYPTTFYDYSNVASTANVGIGTKSSSWTTSVAGPSPLGNLKLNANGVAAASSSTGYWPTANTASSPMSSSIQAYLVPVPTTSSALAQWKPPTTSPSPPPPSSTCTDRYGNPGTPEATAAWSRGRFCRNRRHLHGEIARLHGEVA